VSQKKRAAAEEEEKNKISIVGETLIYSSPTPAVLESIIPKEPQEYTNSWDFTSEADIHVDMAAVSSTQEEEEVRIGDDPQKPQHDTFISTTPESFIEESTCFKSVVETGPEPGVAAEHDPRNLVEVDDTLTSPPVILPQTVLEESLDVSAENVPLDFIMEEKKNLENGSTAQESNFSLEDTLQDSTTQDQNIKTCSTPDPIHVRIEKTEDNPLDPSTGSFFTEEIHPVPSPIIQESDKQASLHPAPPTPTPKEESQVEEESSSSIPLLETNTIPSPPQRISPAADQIAQAYMLQLERLHTQHESEIQEYQRRITQLEVQLAKKQPPPPPPPNPVALHDKCLAQLRKLEKEYTLELQQKEDALMQSQLLVHSMETELNSLKKDCQVR